MWLELALSLLLFHYLFLFQVRKQSYSFTNMKYEKYEIFYE